MNAQKLLNYESLVILLNKLLDDVRPAHFRTGMVQFPTLEFPIRHLPRGRLVAVTGPAEGVKAAARVEGNI